MTYGFPVPFGGIDTLVQLRDEDEVQRVVEHMAAGCGKGHAHNLAIQFDENLPTLWTSALGADCAEDALLGPGAED